MKYSAPHFVGTLSACLLLAIGSTTTARADVVLEWNEALIHYLGGEGAPLHVQARAAAILHVAMEQAILASRPAGEPIGASSVEQSAAAIAAARAALTSLAPAAGREFDALAEKQLRALGAESAKTARASTLGGEAAAVMLRKRESDRWVEIESRQAAIAALSDRLSLPASSGPASPWLTVTPFVLKNVQQFQPDEPHWTDMEGQLHANASLSRARIFDAVDRTAPPDMLCEFWSESPVAAWNRIARTLVERAGLDLASRARVLALVNLAMADATLASHHWQFVWGSWSLRCKTALVPVSTGEMATDLIVRLDDTDQTMVVRPENRQVLIPPVPNYPSLAATVAGAADAALAGALANAPTQFVLCSPRQTGGTAERRFKDLTAAGRECAYVASLDGRHSREACVAGFRLGESIGNYVAKQARRGQR